MKLQGAMMKKVEVEQMVRVFCQSAGGIYCFFAILGSHLAKPLMSFL